MKKARRNAGGSVALGLVDNLSGYACIGASCGWAHHAVGFDTFIDLDGWAHDL